MSFLKKIRKRIYFTRPLRRLFTDELAIQDIQSCSFLSTLLPKNSYLPFTSFSLSPTLILHVINDMILLNRSTIVEFGSGISTVIIAKLISLHSLNAKLYSVDQDSKWQGSLNGILESESINNHVELITAEIVNLPNFSEEKANWYSKEILNERLPKEIDLMLVDGPTLSTGSHSRIHALPFVIENLSNNFSIFLDDTYRKGEQEILTDWKELLQMNYKEFIRYAIFTTNTTVSTVPISLSYTNKYIEYLKLNNIV
jgi:hypothetical protein